MLELDHIVKVLREVHHFRYRFHVLIIKRYHLLFESLKHTLLPFFNETVCQIGDLIVRERRYLLEPLHELPFHLTADVFHHVIHFELMTRHCIILKKDNSAQQNGEQNLILPEIIIVPNLGRYGVLPAELRLGLREIQEFEATPDYYFVLLVVQQLILFLPAKMFPSDDVEALVLKGLFIIVRRIRIKKPLQSELLQCNNPCVIRIV